MSEFSAQDLTGGKQDVSRAYCLSLWELGVLLQASVLVNRIQIFAVEGLRPPFLAAISN